MAAESRVLIAGAGIGGLTAALALAARGMAATVLEAAPELEEIGAGIQLSPNASRVLLGLGLEAALAPHVVAPETLRVMNARSGREIVAVPLGVPAARRYRAPFWLIHRGDLQRVLLDAARSRPDIELHLGVRVEEFARDGAGIVVFGKGAGARLRFSGNALIAADGLWSTLRGRLGIRTTPEFCRQTAWRALVPAAQVADEFRAAATTLWLGPHAHVVHYPVRGGAAINIVGIIREDWDKQEWSAPGYPAVVRTKVAGWAPALRDLIDVPARWHKWALYDHSLLPQWGIGPVTLLGDAAHAMRPFLAQGAAMAIEDGAVLARAIAAEPDDIPAALRAYERERQPRTARVQREAARNGRRYAWRGPLAVARNMVLARMGGERLLKRYNWLYGWSSDSDNGIGSTHV